jgi:hypothetical protein
MEARNLDHGTMLAEDFRGLAKFDDVMKSSVSLYFLVAFTHRSSSCRQCPCAAVCFLKSKTQPLRTVYSALLKLYHFHGCNSETKKQAARKLAPIVCRD